MRSCVQPLRKSGRMSDPQIKKFNIRRLHRLRRFRVRVDPNGRPKSRILISRCKVSCFRASIFGQEIEACETRKQSPLARRLDRPRNRNLRNLCNLRILYFFNLRIRHSPTFSKRLNAGPHRLLSRSRARPRMLARPVFFRPRNSQNPRPDE